MAIILQFDETSGAQPLTNDVLGVQGVTIPTQLNTQLSTIFNDTGASPIEIGLSSSAGPGTGVVASFGANVTDVGFTDSAGAALNGLDSGLKALDGTAILLYSQSNNNVVYGRVGGASGTIAFVLYLDTGVDTGTADPMATAASLWMVQYVPLEHRDEPSGAPNDVEYLKDKLYVSANSFQEFSLSGAPSGQNLFLMFGDGTPSAADATIVVTGKNPSLTSSVTEGDTVNTGQGGGTTTIGSNNQMVDPGEAMYFTFVKGANVDYTVPNLDQNEADVAANIQFDTYFGATSASFAVVQMQPPKGATLRITAIDNKGTGEKQLGFLQGLAPIANANEALDEFIDVTSVVVTRAIKTGKTVTMTPIAFAPGDGTKNGITVDFAGDTAKITGLLAGDQVMYTTAALHNRVLIENVGNANANLNSAFDIGKFRLESSVQARTALADVAIYDDNPTITGTLVGAPAPTVDESALATDDSDSFAAQFTPVYGRDGAAASSPVTYALSTVGGDSGVIDSATGTAVYLFLQSGQVVGRVGNNAAGAVVFVVSVDASGNVGLDQQRAIMHTPNTGADQSLSLSGTNLVVLTATATDKDGDTASAPLDITSRITMKDDGPSITATLVGAPNPTVDESALATDDSDSFAAQFTPAYGADGAAAASPVTYALSTAGGDSGVVDSASGTAVYLFLQSGQVVGRVGNNAAGAVVFVVSVDSSGNVGLDQQRAIMHTPNTGADQSLSLNGTNLVVLTATATDKDGDTASAPLDITSRITMKDDGPSITATLVGAPAPTVDESALATNDSDSFAAQFTPAYGADGAAAAAPVTYALSTVGGDSGVVDSASGSAVYLFLQNGQVVGRVGNNAAGAVVFVVSVDASGNVGLDQQRAIMHTPNTGADQSLSLSGTNLVVLTATATDKDGDTASAPLDITSRITIKDDGPSITATLVGAPTPTVDESALATDDSDSFAAQFTPVYGADGAAAASPVTYALSTVGGDSGVVDSASGTAVYLFLQSGQVVGRVGNNAAGAVVFVVSVDASGNVGLDQQRAIMHTPNTGADQSLTLSGTNLVVLTATATDKDGDTASAPLDITSRITMKDDGPSITGTLVGAPTPTVDESALATDDSDGFAAQFTPVYGADGAAAASPVTYALSTSGGDSGLIDSATGTGIFLFLQSGVINGRVGNNAAGAIAFVVGVDGSGNVSLDQRSAIMHTPNTGADQSLTMTGTNMVVLTATATDKDGDTASAPLDITARLTFKDDAPTLGFGNVVGTGTALAQYGAWMPNAGADGASVTPGLDITQGTFRLIRPDGTTTTAAAFTLTEGNPSPDGSGAYQFTGSVTADFDNNGSPDATPMTFTLTAFANGRYAIDLTAGFGSSITSFKTSDGLGAGGPDPVQTLYIPNQTSPVETIVFFSAKVSATTAQIQSGIGIATPPNADFDPTEAQLETNPLPAYIDPRNMNVSTSGIGVANNILQGDSNAAITDVDESFVVNAKSLLTSVKVFIDNSVGGYTPATEDLYFRAYYSDGTFTALTDVTAGMLSNEAGNQKSFTITREGSKLIDAVQLVMGRGDVKIPVIEFTRETVSLASDVQLDFNASYTDKDGDAATSSFSAILNANDVSGTPDYFMTGESGQRDDFNIDLSSSRDAYEIAGWDAGGVDDAMVLLASTGATFAIDNSGANAIVTITELGGQQTVVTVIGVNVDNADVLLVGT